MNEGSETLEAELSRQCRSYTDPLFLQDHFLGSGHDDGTHNGTATFIKFGGHHYVCTCQHVAESLSDDTIVGPETRHPTAALMVGKSVINLSFFTEEGIQPALRAPSDEEEYKTDVCIAGIDSHWEFLQTHKDKEAIDLDSWIEPPWHEIRMCAAAGYADEHKTALDDQVSTPMPLVTAELQSELSADTREFTLRSSLEQPHGMYFSGMSGGPIIGVWGDRDYTMIGLIFEGFPSSRTAPPSMFAGPCDLFVRGLLLTPERFGGWLRAMPTVSQN